MVEGGDPRCEARNLIGHKWQSFPRISLRKLNFQHHLVLTSDDDDDQAQSSVCLAFSLSVGSILPLVLKTLPTSLSGTSAAQFPLCSPFQFAYAALAPWFDATSQHLVIPTPIPTRKHFDNLFLLFSALLWLWSNREIRDRHYAA